MLKIRIIPTLLWKEPSLVKGIRFDSWRRIGSILPAINVYNRRQVDELIVLDITATNEAREPDYEMIYDISSSCYCPLTVGGGIKNIENVRKLLRAGADKVCINTSVYSNPKLITDIAKVFGSQCIIVSIDAKKTKNGIYECYSNSGTCDTEYEVGFWARKIESLGAGEVMITSIDHDGVMDGYDLDLIKIVSTNVSIPVIASGGAGTYKDFFRAITLSKASAVAAASMYHFTEQTPIEAKMYLANKGIPVRSVYTE